MASRRRKQRASGSLRRKAAWTRVVPKKLPPSPPGIRKRAGPRREANKGPRCPVVFFAADAVLQEPVAPAQAWNRGRAEPGKIKNGCLAELRPHTLKASGSEEGTNRGPMHMWLTPTRICPPLFFPCQNKRYSHKPDLSTEQTRLFYERYSQQAGSLECLEPPPTPEPAVASQIIHIYSLRARAGR